MSTVKEMISQQVRESSELLGISEKAYKRIEKILFKKYQELNVTESDNDTIWCNVHDIVGDLICRLELISERQGIENNRQLKKALDTIEYWGF